MKVRILGSAPGTPMPNRYNEAILVQVGDSSYLLDAGEPCAATIYNSGLNIYSIKAVFISHTHADHIGGLPMLLQTAWLCQGKGPQNRFTPDNALRLYMPSDAIPTFRRFLRVLRMGEGKLPYKLIIEPIEEGVFYREDKASVSAQPTTHLTPYRMPDDEWGPYSSQAYSFVLQAEGKKVVYSGDMGRPSDIVNLLDATDLLIVECAHFPPEKLFATLPMGKIKRIVVNHLHPDLCNDERRILDAAKAAGRNDVIVAHDNLEIEI